MAVANSFSPLSPPAVVEDDNQDISLIQTFIISVSSQQSAVITNNSLRLCRLWNSEIVFKNWCHCYLSVSCLSLLHYKSKEQCEVTSANKSGKNVNNWQTPRCWIQTKTFLLQQVQAAWGRLGEVESVSRWRICCHLVFLHIPWLIAFAESNVKIVSPWSNI